MSNELKVFESAEFGNVRVVEIDNTPWFVASDVAKALGYVNQAKAIRVHCKKVNKFTVAQNGLPDFIKKNPTPPNLISRGDVYRLIVSSKLPSAERFESWIFDDLIPAVHDHGVYVDEARVDPAFLRHIADALEEKSRQLKEARPAVALCNRLTEHRTEWPICIAAKEIGAFVNTVRDICVTHNLLERVPSYGRWRYLPTKSALKNGLCVQEKGGEKYAFTREGIDWLRQHDAA